MDQTIIDLQQAVNIAIDELEEWGVVLTADCFERLVAV